MSRVVDDSRPYTEEEKAYLLTISGGEDRIALNDRRFADYSKKERENLRDRSIEDEKKEAEIQKRLEEEQKKAEEDSYHPDDVAAVDPLTIAELRKRLEDEGLNAKVTKKDLGEQGEDGDPLTEKSVLAYRLLNHLDEKRQELEKVENGA